MNKFLGYIIGIIMVMIASIVFLTIEVYDDDSYSQAEVNETIDQLETSIDILEEYNLNNQIKIIYLEQELISESFYLNTKILRLEDQLKKADIMLDIINETEYNTVEAQCLTDDYYVCYNDYFYYHIDSNDKIVLLFSEYNVIGIQMTLERQADGDFYYTKVGMIDGSSALGFTELYEINISTDYGSTAVSLIQDIIEDEDWTSYDSIEDWEALKIRLEITEE